MLNQPLTPREKEVYDLLLQGLTVQQIADKLIIARCTTATLIQNILSKFEAHSRLELCAKKIIELNSYIEQLLEQIEELQCT